MKKTLVILAAGMGTRFGGGIKQLEPVDDNGHIIIDYSIHDAIEAGFNKIVFIIRHDIEEDFKSIIGNRIEKEVGHLGVTIEYAFQELSEAPIIVDGRTKPWGTGHAVLACKDIIDSSFAVINADDYYGKNSFRLAADFLETNQYALVGYQLKNTLSDNGGVTRGVCSVEQGKLVCINETKDIVKTKDGAQASGVSLDMNTLVSMNFWCYPKEFICCLEKGFQEFLSDLKEPMTDEYLLPIIADGMLKAGVEYKVLPTDDIWFGVTYKEDKPAVVESFRELVSEGVYKEELYSDLITV